MRKKDKSAEGKAVVKELIREPGSYSYSIVTILSLLGISVFLGISIGITSYSYSYIILGLFVICGILIVFAKPWIGYLLLVCSLPFRSFSLASVGTASIRISEVLFIMVAFALAVNVLVKTEIKIQRSQINLPLIFFSIWMLLSFLWLSDSISGIVQCSRVIFGILLFFLSIHVIESHQKFQHAINAWISVGFIIASITIYEFLISGFPYLAQHYKKVPTVFTQALRSSIFLSPTLLASYLNLCIFLAIGKLLILKRTKQRVIIIGVIFVLFCALVFTFSRGGWAGFLCGLIYILYKSNNLKKFIVISLISLIIFIFFSGGIIKEVISMRLISYAHPQEDPAFQERLILWNATKKVILDNPILGVGIGNSSRALDKLSLYYPTRFRYIHNLYFYILAELGVIGFLLFLLICICIVRAIANFLRENEIEEYKKMTWIFAAGLISYAVHGAVHFHLAERHIWAFLGLGMALIINKGIQVRKKEK